MYDGDYGYYTGEYGTRVFHAADNTLLSLRNSDSFEPVEHVCLLHSRSG